MAKTKRHQSNSMMSQINQRTNTAEAAKPEPVAEETKPASVKYLTLRIPVAEVESPTFRLHVDIDYQGEVAQIARMVAAGLTESGEKLNSGKPCFGANDAHRWIHEEMTRQIGD